MIRSKKIYLISFLILGLFIANFASAAIVNCGTRSNPDPCTIGDLITTLRLIVNTLLSWAWLVSIVMIVWSGFQMVMAAGNEEALSKAKASLTNAILGFVLILISFVLVNFVIGLLTGDFNPGALQDAFHLLPVSENP
jgi:hypothetical protein